MSRTTSYALALIALFLVVTGAIYAATLPARAARAFETAVADGDAEALRALVDFDALREDLKHQLLDSFHRAEPDARLGMIVSRYVGALVDGLVTPKTLFELMAADVALEPSRARWTSVSSAVVEVTRGEEIVGRWTLERRGLSLVLVGIELPAGMTGELEQRWAERLRQQPPSADEERALTEESARACAAWRKRALARLQTLVTAQRAYHDENGRYAADTALLEADPAGGPELYDFVITQGDERSFTLQARGKALMAGDVLQARDGSIRVLRDACSP